MAKIGKKEIQIPESTNVELADRIVTVTGPKGTLTFKIHPEISVKVDNNSVFVDTLTNSRVARDTRGTTRTVIFNMIKGVTDGWSKSLEVSGTGFRAAVSGNSLTLNLGFSHPVVVEAPEGIKFDVKDNIISVSGADKVRVGEVAAIIRSSRRADPYKAKGIKYVGEIVRRKAGKAVKAAGAA